MPDKAVDLAKTLSTTQEQILGKNPSRVYALFVNDGTEDIYLGMGIPAVVNRGIRLNKAGGNYEITAINPWYGEVSAVAGALTPLLLIVEW